MTVGQPLWHRSGFPEGDRSRGSSVEGAHSDREFGHLTNEPAAPGMGPDYRALRDLIIDVEMLVPREMQDGETPLCPGLQTVVQ